MYSVKTGVFVSNDGRVVTAKSLSRKDMDEAAKLAGEYDLQDARNFAANLGREPTARELVTRSVRHHETRKQVVIQTPQQKSEDEFITEQIAFLQQNPGTDKADRASKKKELKRWEDRLKLLHKNQEAEQTEIAIAIEELKINPVTEDDQGRRIHATNLLKQLALCEMATVEDVEKAVERTKKRGTKYDESLDAWKLDFLDRIEKQTTPQPSDTVAKANELLEQRNRIKSMVEMPESKTPVKEVEKIDRVKLPDNLRI